MHIADFNHIVMEKEFMSIDIPTVDTVRSISFSFRSPDSLEVSFVSETGESMVACPAGSVCEYNGPMEGLSMLSIKGKPGQMVAYSVEVVGPRRRFEKNDPRPLTITSETSVEPAVSDAVRDYIDLVLQQRGLSDTVETDEVIDDMAEDFEFSEDEDEPGPGHYEELPDPEPEAVPPDPPPPAPEPELPVDPKDPTEVQKALDAATAAKEAETPPAVPST